MLLVVYGPAAHGELNRRLREKPQTARQLASLDSMNAKDRKLESPQREFRVREGELEVKTTKSSSASWR